MAIKILAVQIWAFCAPCELVGSGGAIRVPGPSALLTRNPLALVIGMSRSNRLTATVSQDVWLITPRARPAHGPSGLAAHSARSVEDPLT
jgi:hypothetical protein